MRVLAVTAATIMLIASPAAAKDWKLTLVPGASQQVTYQGGRQVVGSDTPPQSGAQIEIGTDRFDLKQSPVLFLTVKNYGAQPVNFTGENVVVATDLGELTVLSVGDIQAQARAVEKKAKQAAMWQALAVGLQAGSAGMSQTSTYNAHTYSPYGSSWTSGSITTPGNQAASAAILANGQNQIAATRAQGRDAAAEIMAGADDQGFHPATIEANGVSSTPLTLSRLPPKAQTLKVMVNLNGATHVFDFKLSQLK